MVDDVHDAALHELLHRDTHAPCNAQAVTVETEKQVQPWSRIAPVRGASCMPNAHRAAYMVAASRMIGLYTARTGLHKTRCTTSRVAEGHGRALPYPRTPWHGLLPHRPAAAAPGARLPLRRQQAASHSPADSLAGMLVVLLVLVGDTGGGERGRCLQVACVWVGVGAGRRGRGAEASRFDKTRCLPISGDTDSRGCCPSQVGVHQAS
jgi:hypothetical protein